MRFTMCDCMKFSFLNFEFYYVNRDIFVSMLLLLTKLSNLSKCGDLGISFWWDRGVSLQKKKQVNMTNWWTNMLKCQKYGQLAL